MVTYKPEQREVKVEILSRQGWISGGIYIGKVNLFQDAINAMPNILKVTDACFQDGRTLPFLALHHKAVEVIVPCKEGLDTVARKQPGEPVKKRVECFVNEGIIEGDLHTGPNLRVSDFLANCKGYFLMHNPSIEERREEMKSDGNSGKTAKLALVNGDNFIGVREL